jgi:hypothetical protein
MRLVTALAAAILMACATAEAQRPEGFEPAAEGGVAALRGCLANHRPDERSQCVRQMTRACIDASGPYGETTEGALVCTRHEQMAWRAIMDENVAALRGSESATQRILLDTTLRGGEQWANWLCAYDASYHEAGSLAQIRAAECHRDSAAERALFFYARFNDR